MNISNFIEELKRRNVFKVATAYAIAGWVIIQVFDIIAPQFGFPEWLPPLVTILVLIGFPIVLIIAWAFELTPDGIEKSKDVEITESVTISTGKKLNGVIIASLGVLVILLLSERIFFAESTIFDSDSVKIESASIAVLPFVNMSADESNEYFSDGLSEELLNGLAKIEGMQVAGRTSSFSFKGKNEDLRIIAEQLGVKHILEGSVRKDGDQVRITAQLIQADNGFHLWSETYDRELESIFAIQEEISRQVVQELKVRLLPGEVEIMASRPTEDIEAYNAFLEATQLEVSRQPDDLEAAIKKYKQAIDIDPSFALAHARLAIAYNLLFDYGSLRFEDMIESMNDHINSALRLNEDLGEAYLAKAMLELDKPDEDSPVQAEIIARRADELLPNNASVINILQSSLRSQDKQEEADEFLKKAYRLDPLSSPITGNMAAMYRRDGEIDKALELVEKNIKRHPEYTPIYLTKLDILRFPPKSDLVEAFEFIHELHQREPEDLEFLRALSLTSRDLNMPGYSNYLVSEMQRLYPDNFDVLFAQFTTNILLDNPQENVAVMDALRERFGPSVIRLSTNPYSIQFVVMGDFEKAAAIISDEFPEISDGTVEYESGLNSMLNSDFGSLSIRYAASLIKLGSEEEAEPLINRLCDFYEVDSYPKILAERELDQLYNAGTCAALNGNVDEYVANYKEIYFGNNMKLGWPLYFKDSSIHALMKDEPEAIKLKETILSEVNSLKQDAVNYLKEEGKWREEWEVEED